MDWILCDTGPNKVFYIFWNEMERGEACNRLNTSSISLQHLNTTVQFSPSFSSENVGESLYIKGDFGCCTLTAAEAEKREWR